MSSSKVLNHLRIPVKVPTGLAIFPEEIQTIPRPFAEYKYKVSISMIIKLNTSIFTNLKLWQ